MSPKFNSERVVCPDKYFLTVCAFPSKLRVAAFRSNRINWSSRWTVLEMEPFLVFHSRWSRPWVAHWPNADNRGLSLFSEKRFRHQMALVPPTEVSFQWSHHRDSKERSTFNIFITDSGSERVNFFLFYLLGFICEDAFFVQQGPLISLGDWSNGNTRGLPRRGGGWGDRHC